jgi:succinoglycan biosynthesis protein ExoW
MRTASRLSVIIPFFQREPGILARSLRSVAVQKLPQDFFVEIIIVDDGSPVPAASELEGAQFPDAFSIRIIRQDNRGVAVARNRGLSDVDKESDFIAFLDSDDIWPDGHLAHAIEAMEQGFDLYFADNQREGRHVSYCRSSPFAPMTMAFIESSGQKAGFLEIPKDLMIGLTLAEFPCQASTVAYRRDIAPKMRFDNELAFTGEDVLFFTALATSANRICFDLDSIVECGSGVNIYFSNLTINDERFLPIKVDKYVTHFWIAKRFDLSDRNRDWNTQWLSVSRKDLVYHLIRSLFSRPGSAAREIGRLIKIAPRAAIATLPELPRLAFGRLAKTIATFRTNN